MEKQERSSFSSRVGFVLAASGSAVGLGNLWRFPYLAARYGGGIFLLVYLILVVTFGFSLMITEFAIGRKTRLSCIGAYGALDKRFNFLGWIAAFVPLIITPYYCVIGGWVMKYLWTFISGGALEAADNGGFFSRFISFDAGSLPATILNFSGPTPWFVLFVLITGLVVIFGVQKGIENASRLMMPVLAVLIVVIALYSLTIPGALAGLKYYLMPDFSQFSASTVLGACGQMFYSMSLAMGITITYGSYMPKENLRQYLTNTNGNFDGVGIEIYTTQDGEVVISSVMPGQPAETAGLQAGDVIIGVDGEDMKGKLLSDVAAKIHGEKGTAVTIRVQRGDEEKEFTMERATVEVESVSSRMMENKIGYISISGFKENTYSQFKEALTALQKDGMKGLILDLRDNPGGLVRSVYEIGDELLPEGTMVYTLDKKQNRNDLKCDEKYLDIPLVVLVNENSASASEIFAGAVKDTGRGTLVGNQTFGKGLVQRLFVLPDGSGLNVTVQKYYTPNGTSIHGVGIEPDEKVELPEAYSGTPLTEIPAEQDTQLQKGLQVMEEQLK